MSSKKRQDATAVKKALIQFISQKDRNLEKSSSLKVKRNILINHNRFLSKIERVIKKQ